MPDEQTTWTDSEVLLSAARMLESLAEELRNASRSYEDREATFAYKSAHTLDLVAITLREWAQQLMDDGFIDQLMRSEAVLRMVRPGA
jgi:hypothetical protein